MYMAQETSCGPDTIDYQQRMIRACENGNVQLLQELLHACGVVIGDHATQRDADTMHHSDLLYASVTHRQPATLTYLLEVYPYARVLNDTLLRYAKPDVSTLKVLYDHDPSIIHYRMEHTQGSYTLLMEYCGTGDPTLASFLLNVGADPNEHGMILPINPLQQAIQFGQPASLILLMIQYHVKIDSFHIHHAIDFHRTDLLGILLHRCQWKYAAYIPSKERRNVRLAAYEKGNKESIAIVEDYMKSQMPYRKLWRFLSPNSPRSPRVNHIKLTKEKATM